MYDINDPFALAEMNSRFEGISEREWTEFKEWIWSELHRASFHPRDRDLIAKALYAHGRASKLSPKQVAAALGVVDRIEEMKERLARNEVLDTATAGDLFVQPVHHVTFRVAWHDNKWNGHVCKDPEGNIHCSGYNSLLSDRLRRNKNEHIAEEIANKGQRVTDGYLPPCFWSLNLFGDQPMTARHINPALPNLEPIVEALPAHSMYSWPFAVSFTRTQAEVATSGAYPQNLENVRIPLYRARIHDNESVAFFYAKFSNPLTEDDQQYLVVGCGVVTGHGDPKHFGPPEVIEARRQQHKYRNFPSMNWALRYTFDDPNQMVRMPYHEYLEHVEQPGVDEAVKQERLERIKVAITEPELEHCFKYVSRTVGNDEAIYILSKMRQRLKQCRNDGIVPVAEMQQRIDAVEQMLWSCWRKRGHFPGLGALCRAIKNTQEPVFALDNLVQDIQRDEEDPSAMIIALVKDPGSHPEHARHAPLIKEIVERAEQSHGLSTDDLLRLSLLDLDPQQFRRILEGKLHCNNGWGSGPLGLQRSHELSDVVKNPYLLFEDYQVPDDSMDDISGEEIDAPIDLFKIDIAYFPDLEAGAERIALQEDMRFDDARRLRAVVIRHLRDLENTGHCFSDADELEQAVKEYPLYYASEGDYALPHGFFERLPDKHIVHFEEDGTKLKVVKANDTHYFYLNEVHEAELEIADTLTRLMNAERNAEAMQGLAVHLDRSSSTLSDLLGTTFDEGLFRSERERAFDGLYHNRLTVLTGGAGSGKSFELLTTIKDLERQGQKYLLLAPTGKAALRLKTDREHPDIQAYTIDKFLADFLRRGPLHEIAQRVNNVIIDELSMVDLLKLKKLLKCFSVDRPSFKRLILVGDPNQLPAIGYGKVLRDIVEHLKSDPVRQKHYVELQTNCRNELATSAVPTLSESFVHQGELTDEWLARLNAGEDHEGAGLRILYWSTKDELFEKIRSSFTSLTNGLGITGNDGERLEHLLGLMEKPPTSERLDTFQVLSPYRSDYYGTTRVNKLFQDQYRTVAKAELMDGWFKNGDKVIRTKNYYAKRKLHLSNGSIGTIREARPDKLYFPELSEPMKIRGGEPEDLRKGEREFFDLAYATTVHKAQGSGFDHVFAVIPKKPGLLSRELVYTAITRCKKSLTLFLQQEPGEVEGCNVLIRAARRSHSESRRTSLFMETPYRTYKLEADGYFFQSRVEMIIYETAKEVIGRLAPNASFVYEVRPEVDDTQLPMKTDFTITNGATVWYWEHLGRLGIKRYEREWAEVKRPSYRRAGVEERLVTTHEQTGIAPDKIRALVEQMLSGELGTEDAHERYSLHHFGLR